MLRQLRKSGQAGHFGRDLMVAMALMGSGYAIVTIAGFAATL